jgi:hypothetical protein
VLQTSAAWSLGLEGMKKKFLEKINTAGGGTLPVKRDRDGDDGDAGRRSTKAAR